MSVVRLILLSDVHVGVHCDLDQIDELERWVPEAEPTGIVVAGDLTQRARHGEFQRALALVNRLRRTAPVLVVPGNHDVQWWASPLHLLGTRRLHAKYRRYFPELTPTLAVPGALLVGTLSAHGVAPGSMTWNLRDIAVKGHLPRIETDRAARLFAEADPGLLRVVALHHNVLRGEISRRMGLAHWRSAQARLDACGADLVLCGHDHQESVGQLDGGAVVVASSTHSNRTRGGHPTVFQVIEADAESITVRPQRWDAGVGRFMPAGEHRFARRRPEPLDGGERGRG